VRELVQRHQTGLSQVRHDDWPGFSWNRVDRIQNRRPDAEKLVRDHELSISFEKELLPEGGGLNDWRTGAIYQMSERSPVEADGNLTEAPQSATGTQAERRTEAIEGCPGEGVANRDTRCVFC